MLTNDVRQDDHLSDKNLVVSLISFCVIDHHSDCHGTMLTLGVGITCILCSHHSKGKGKEKGDARCWSKESAN